jgi:hypothetical protein
LPQVPREGYPEINFVLFVCLKAQIEVSERLREHEAVKMIRLKTGLVKWSDAHKELAAKSHIIFSATRDISQLIPDVADTAEIQVTIIESMLF